jgi:hypothetical protein
MRVPHHQPTGIDRRHADNWPRSTPSEPRCWPKRPAWASGDRGRAGPAATVRGWLRRAGARAEPHLAQVADPLLDAAQPTGSALGDAIEALGRDVAAAVRLWVPETSRRPR